MFFSSSFIILCVFHFFSSFPHSYSFSFFLFIYVFFPKLILQVFLIILLSFCKSSDRRIATPWKVRTSKERLSSSVYIVLSSQTLLWKRNPWTNFRAEKEGHWHSVHWQDKAVRSKGESRDECGLFWERGMSGIYPEGGDKAVQMMMQQWVGELEEKWKILW